MRDEVIERLLGALTDYPALEAWGTVIGAAVTFAAVVVALRQSLSSRRDLERQLRHQHALEERAAEQQLLAAMLAAIRLRYETLRDHGAALEGEMAAADILTQPVRASVDALLRATSKSTAEFAAQIHMMRAVGKQHAARGNTAASEAYDDIVTLAVYAHQATKRMEHWAATLLQAPNLRAYPFEDSPFEHVETAHNEAMIAVTNRIAALLAPPD